MPRCCAGFWWGTLTEWRSPAAEASNNVQQEQRAVIAASAPAGNLPGCSATYVYLLKSACPLLLTVRSSIRPSVRPCIRGAFVCPYVRPFVRWCLLSCLSLSRGPVRYVGGIGRSRGGRSSKRPTQFQPGSQLLLVLRRSAENGACRSGSKQCFQARDYLTTA